jgi:AAA family ATP:ADP antiporter
MALLDGITRRLSLEQHERRTLVVMGALVAVLMCAYTLAKVLRDALFLTEFESFALPYAYIGVALASAGFVWLESRVQRRYTRVAASRFSQILAIAFSIFAAIVFPHAPHRTAAMFYLWTGSQAMLLLPHFWLLALDVWDSRRARRLFPVLGGCGLLGGAVGGAFGAWSLPLLRRVGLMWTLAGLLVLAHLLTRLLERQRVVPNSPARAAAGDSPWSIIRSSRYIQIFALGLSLSVVVATLVDFQFKVMLQQSYPDTPSLTQFLGRFYIALNVAALLIQFGLAGWLTQRFGLGPSTGLQPAVVMLFSPVVAAGGGWWAVVALRWIQGVVFQTLGKPSSEIYYTAIRPNVRRRIKATVDTLAERWSDALVGVLLIVLLHVLHVPLTAIAIGTGVAAALWLLVLLRLNRYYGQAFQQVLSRRWLEPEEAPDAFRMPAARKALFDALQGDDEAATALALELCAGVRDPAIALATYGCLRHPSPTVVAAALATMESAGIPDPQGIADGLLEHGDPAVKRAAVGYLLATKRNPVAFARELLQRSDSELRRFVVDALFERPEVASGAVTAEWVDRRLSAGTEEDLLLAARGLGSMRGAPAGERLRKLLDQPNVEIRRATLLSFARRPNRSSIGFLVDQLFVPDLALEAREAVAAIGDDAIPALRRLINGSGGPMGQSVAARTLAYIATPRAIRVLLPLVRQGDLRLRHLGLLSLARARVRAGRPILPRRLAHRFFLRELRDYRRERDSSSIHVRSDQPEVRLLAASFREGAQMALERAIAALACWYDPKPLAGVYDRLISEDRNEAAPALEYLGHALPRGIFRPVTRIFESVEEEDSAAPGDSLPALLQAAWNSGDAWLQACTVRASRYVPEFDSSVFAGEAHPLVRAELQSLHLGEPPARQAATC